MVLKKPQIDKNSYISFFLGKVINQPFSEELLFEVNFPKHEHLPHLLGDAIPLASNTLVDCLKTAGIENIQTFPAVLVNPKSGQKWDNYTALNIIGLINSVNLEASLSDTLMSSSPGGPPPLVAFRTIVIDKDRVNNISMFRLAESAEVVIVDDKLVNVLNDNRPEDGWGLNIRKCD